MHFRFVLWNHNKVGQRSLEDVIGIMGHQLRALGHGADWIPGSKEFIGREHGYNVIVEGFTPDVVKDLARIHSEGARFICLATEEPSEKGFNQGTQKEMVWRQQCFPSAGPYLDGILHLVPGDHVTKWYGQFAPTAYTELGYAISLVRPYDPTPPKYDFGFYGSLTPRRMSIIKRLAKRIGTENAVRIVPDFATQANRDRIMREAKVILQLRKFEEMGLVSSSRCVTSLCLHRPVVAEPHLLSKPWDEIVRFSSSMEEFFNLAIAMRGCWRSVWEGQFEKFRARLTPEHCVGQALERIGVLKRIAA